MRCLKDEKHTVSPCITVLVKTESAENICKNYIFRGKQLRLPLPFNFKDSCRSSLWIMQT